MKTVVVIGGGPAGMAAAYGARASGTENVILVERYDYLGGVLPQCIHNGFGTQIYNRDYTGCEYAALWQDLVEQNSIEIRLNCTVLSIKKDEKNVKWQIKWVSKSSGAEVIAADAVIVATGCRERTLPQLGVTGSRPSGIFTAGTAQAMMNLKNYLPGKTAVILGSGDIGLIMARRMTLEGMKVKLILGEKSTGLPRNIVQCVEDFDIPLKYGWTVISTHGYQRLKGVNIAPFTDDGSIDYSNKQYIPCDTLLVATGLIPETEVCEGYKPGEDDGFFICGNAGGVHDLVDNVTEEGLEIGLNATEYVCGHVSINETLSNMLNHRISGNYTGREGNMVCTACPKGCMMQVTLSDNMLVSVIGNECERGHDFAKQEIIDPKRIITTIVKISGGNHPVLSVKTDKAVSKTDMTKIIDCAKKVKCSAPVTVGDIIAENVAGLNVNLIGTNNIYPVEDCAD